MRNLICIALFIALCSNECNAPYRASIVCRNGRNGGDSCRFRFSNNLEFLLHGADVSWWKGSLEVGIWYRAKNTSAGSKDSMDYSRFSLVSSAGINFYQAARKAGAPAYPFMRVFAPGSHNDTILLFVSADKFAKHQAMDALKNQRFFLLYSDGGTDTLASVMGNDSQIR